MPTIFLSHTSLDKPFVEKLAASLSKIGVNAWFDKWEIKVGESLTWKIEEGIRENEFFGIILSPEALNSEWVRGELGAAWARQMNKKKVGVLPILYRQCDIPLLLADRKFADFRSDYQAGFRDLAMALGLKNSDVVGQDNWRHFAKSKSLEWRQFRVREFEMLVTVLLKRAKQYNWSTWVGGTRTPFSITLHAFIDKKRQASISFKLDGKTLAYKATLQAEYNPNHLKTRDFDIYVGNSVNECEEFAWRHMNDFYHIQGNPFGQAYHHVERFLSYQDKIDLSLNVIDQLTWDKSREQHDF